MTKNLYCVVGESGSGKDTIVNYMCNRYGYTKVISNTTRPIRTNDENDKLNHIFSNVEQYLQDKENNEVVAETFLMEMFIGRQKHRSIILIFIL